MEERSETTKRCYECRGKAMEEVQKLDNENEAIFIIIEQAQAGDQTTKRKKVK